MQAARGQFLAGPPLSQEQDRTVDRRHPGEPLLEIEKWFRLAEGLPAGEEKTVSLLIIYNQIEVIYYTLLYGHN